MKKYDVERGLITKLLETKDMILVKDLQIKPYFFTGEHRKVFNFLSDHFMKTGEILTVRAFKQQFPRYEMDSYINPSLEETVGTEESLKHWCDEVRKKVTHNKIAEATEKIADHLENFDAETAYDLMKKTVLYVENEVVETSAVDITKDTEDRKRQYLERKENQGMIGIPMGIDKLDYILKGLQKKQLTTMIAQTGLGKTWFECLIGSYAQLNGYRVLHFTTEMSEEMLRDRYEAILFGRVVGEFSYSRFKSGMLRTEEEKAYFEFLDKKLPKLEPLIIETATGVSNVASKIDQYQPDLVLIDSAYLMEDDRGAKDDWLRIAHITRDLKNLSKLRKVPIFINSQADRTTSTKTGPELENIGYSRAIGQDSDVVLALFQDAQMREDREMKVKVLKQREGILGYVMMNWDFSTMNFEPIYATAEQSEDSKDEREERGVVEIE